MAAIQKVLLLRDEQFQSVPSHIIDAAHERFLGYVTNRWRRFTDCPGTQLLKTPRASMCSSISRARYPDAALGLQYPNSRPFGMPRLDASRINWMCLQRYR